jgi:predicted RNA-binding protein (virulence factor B family)
MKLPFISLWILGSTMLMADGSSVSISSKELRAATDNASAVVRRDRLEARIYQPSRGGSKVSANKNKNLNVVHKSKIDNSTVGMSISAK